MSTPRFRARRLWPIGGRCLPLVGGAFHWWAVPSIGGRCPPYDLFVAATRVGGALGVATIGGRCPPYDLLVGVVWARPTNTTRILWDR
jgi:hypothetical protein